ncbi:F-box/kelch-repeat protein At3g06240-like [Lycium barbarum]|uniref:F-box/kelch-repeat protein At3g06240-like n=1 Tax=Lycium barbarum TaxID=112863 RepID=UPI00293EDA16|nr:F-box/kelch-repeat protein At3g06240-like [Lycium barbarum]
MGCFFSVFLRDLMNTFCCGTPPQENQQYFPIMRFRAEIVLYGFGYDATSDDYKILKIDGNSPHVSPHMEPRLDSLAFVHGAFHWLGLSECIAMSDSGFTLVSFGVSNEAYGEIPLLERMCYVSNSMSDRLVISVLGGMLCFHSTHNPHGEGTFMLWVMKDYGVKESWTELFTIRETSIYPVRPIYRFGNGEVLLCCGLRFRYGSVFRTSKGPFGSWPQGYGDAYPSQEGFAYIESLIFPKLLT